MKDVFLGLRLLGVLRTYVSLSSGLHFAAQLESIESIDKHKFLAVNAGLQSWYKIYSIEVNIIVIAT